MDELLAQYVASFAKLGEMLANESLDPFAWSLAAGEPDQYGNKRWQALSFKTDASLLDPIYAQIPTRFPRLYERFVTTYRWAQVDLGTYRLVANPPGPDLSGLFAEMSRDQGLWTALIPLGYVPFAKGPDIDYDPVCFDLSSRQKNGHMSIVKIDHEEILCNNRVKVVAALARSFEELVVDTVARANATKEITEQ